MKKWEEQNRLKNHRRKVQSAKPTLQVRPNSGLHHSRPSLRPESASLLPLLKQFNLQQYFRKLKDRGYEQNIRGLSELSQREFGSLMEEMSVLPGHITNFQKLIRLLEEIESSNLVKSNTQLIRPVSDASTHQSPLKSTQQLQAQLEAARQMIAELESQLVVNSVSPIQLDRKIPVEISRDSFFDTPPAFEECKNPVLHKTTVGQSIDSWKLKSTLSNIDIEEVCRCFARALEQHIAESESIPSAVHNIRHKLANVFVEDPTDPSDAYNFVRNLVSRAQLENQVPILALVYIDRLVAKSGIRLYLNNWKRLTFVSFMEASKVWDDESFENQSFAQAFTRFDISEINKMESAFLTLMDFEMKVSSSDFAKSYFVLRSYAHDKDSSLPLEAMDVHSVLRLQHNSQEFSVTAAKLNKSL